MIKNIPNESNYRKNAIECWVQAIETLYEIDKHIYELNLEEDLAQEVYEFSQPHYRTSIVLLHQGLEAIMKSIICKHSPFLLVDNKRTDWPVLPNQTDKDFNELFTIGAESLLYTFCAVSTTSISQESIQFLERIRKLRNEIVHGFNAQIIDPKNIIIDILTSFTLFIGKDAWWEETRSFNWDHPLFSYYDSSFERASFAIRLEFVVNKIGKGEFLKHSTFPIKQRRYLCPVCKQDYERKVDSYEYKWAVLIPNSPTSTSLKCYNCEEESEVLRKCCNVDGCKGNVLAINDDKEECMTCGRMQE